MENLDRAKHDSRESFELIDHSDLIQSPLRPYSETAALVRGSWWKHTAEFEAHSYQERDILRSY